MKIETVEIAKLELQRGDILLVRVPPNWTPEQKRMAQAAVAAAMDRIDVDAVLLIGTTDVDFQIVRAQKPIELTETAPGFFEVAS